MLRARAHDVCCRTPLTKTPEGYAVQLRFHPKSVFGYSWVGHDLGPVVTGLFKLYNTRFSEINDVDFDVDHAKASVGDIIDEISKGKCCIRSMH